MNMKPADYPKFLEQNWNVLNPLIKEFTEEQLFDLMQEERKGQGRPYILLRIHQRYNKVRAERERIELCK